MKRIDRWLLQLLARRNPQLIHETDLPEQLAGHRAITGTSRAEIAATMDSDPIRVLAFEMGLLDPPMSEVRRYAWAAGVAFRFGVHVGIATRGAE